MLHSKRIWSIFPAESAEWLAKQLTQCTYCGCNGFQLGKYVFVNDATCPPILVWKSAVFWTAFVSVSVIWTFCWFSFTTAA